MNRLAYRIKSEIDFIANEWEELAGEDGRDAAEEMLNTLVQLTDEIFRLGMPGDVFKPDKFIAHSYEILRDAVVEVLKKNFIEYMEERDPISKNYDYRTAYPYYMTKKKFYIKHKK